MITLIRITSKNYWSFKYTGFLCCKKSVYWYKMEITFLNNSYFILYVDSTVIFVYCNIFFIKYTKLTCYRGCNSVMLNTGICTPCVFYAQLISPVYSAGGVCS